MPASFGSTDRCLLTKFKRLPHLSGARTRRGIWSQAVLVCMLLYHWPLQLSRLKMLEVPMANTETA